MTNTESIRALTLDGIALHATRVCDDPDGYDRIFVLHPGTGQRLAEISWHRDTRQLGFVPHSQRRWSFGAIDEMEKLGGEWLAWSEETAAFMEKHAKNFLAPGAAG